jgi:hypothetical protein
MTKSGASIFTKRTLLQKRVRREQPAHFRCEKLEGMLTAKHQDELNRRELDEDRSQNEEHARVLRERDRMIDPQRGDSRREKQQGDNKTLRRFRLLAVENQKRQTGDEREENNDFNGPRILKSAQQFVTGPAAALLFGSEPAF